VEDLRAGDASARFGEHRVAAKQRDPVGRELRAHARDETSGEVVEAGRGADLLHRDECVDARIGKGVDHPPLLDRHTVDLFDLAHEQLHEILAGQYDRELVDGDVLAALQDLDADDVRARRADARRDETQRARAVGEPDAHDDVGFHDASVRWPSVTERLGILGGTFDPVHVAHLVAALEARYQLGLDRVLLVVAGDPWQKRAEVAASATDRYDMVAAAVDGLDGLEACALELERAGPTYTIDTVDALARADRHIVLIVGSDVANRIHTWHRADDLRDRVELAVVTREGERIGALAGWSLSRVTMPRLDVSSTDIRRRVACGAPVEFLVPAAAVRVLRERRLYTRR